MTAGTVLSGPPGERRWIDHRDAFNPVEADDAAQDVTPHQGHEEFRMRAPRRRLTEHHGDPLDSAPSVSWPSAQEVSQKASREEVAGQTGTAHEGLICPDQGRGPTLMLPGPKEFSMRLTTRIGAVLAGLVALPALAIAATIGGSTTIATSSRPPTARISR